VIHVYAIRGRTYELIDAFAEKCSFNRLAVKVRKLARRYGAWFVIIENTARGSDLIEEMNLKLPGVYHLSQSEGKEIRAASCSATYHPQETYSHS
jgi:phage terminase large subunit-like protein